MVGVAGFEPAASPSRTPQNFQSERAGSNRRPRRPERRALPAELLSENLRGRLRALLHPAKRGKLRHTPSSQTRQATLDAAESYSTSRVRRGRTNIISIDTISQMIDTRH